MSERRAIYVDGDQRLLLAPRAVRHAWDAADPNGVIVPRAALRTYMQYQAHRPADGYERQVREAHDVIWAALAASR